MIAHLLGNGPSKKDFTNDPVGDVFGCNLADAHLPLKATFIMDRVVVDHIQENKVKLNFPVVIPESLSYRIKECNPRIDIYGIVYKDLENGESTGHHAVQYLLKKGYIEIHMWGFDSLYKESIESDSHVKIPEGPFCTSNWKKWRTNWDKIFNSELGQKCKFVIHRPS